MSPTAMAADDLISAAGRLALVELAQDALLRKVAHAVVREFAGPADQAPLARLKSTQLLSSYIPTIHIQYSDSGGYGAQNSTRS